MSQNSVSVKLMFTYVILFVYLLNFMFWIMTITFGRLVKSRVRRMVGLLAVASVAGAGLCGVASAAGLAAPVRVHRQVAPMESPKAHRLVPQQGKAKGYSTGLLPRRSPKMVSEIVKDRTAMSSTWRDADGSM